MSINKVILVGNVGKDPEVRYIDENLPVARFPLATSEKGYTTRDGREVPERTEWHNIVVWRRLAEVVERFVKKGTQLYLEGKIRTTSYEKDGIKRYSTEIVVDVLQLLGSPHQGENRGTGGSTGSTPTSSAAGDTDNKPENKPEENTDNKPDEQDDLPF